MPVTWADVICEVAAPQVALAEFHAFLDSVFEDAARARWGDIDRGVIYRTVTRTLPGRIKAVKIHGSISI